MELIGNLKNYQWGNLGQASEVAKLAELNSSEFTADAGTPYAELWMGDHHSGPSKLKSTGEELGNFLQSNRDVIGGQEKLPFLFKVLSIRQALSIQVHPNKEEAERLNAERPDIYQDPNHKPELAIALTPFLAMCGFRPYNEILEFLRQIPPLVELLGKNNVEALREGIEGLKVCFRELMSVPQDEVAACIKDIAENYAAVLKEHKLYDTFNTINHDFPNDVGILCLGFLNLIQLQPGEAIFLSANEPHAYLQGDCIECMACSDNVIRAGLTPKYKDVTTLLKMLNYEGLPPEKKLFKPIEKDECLELFIPEIKDFAVAKLCIPASMDVYEAENQKFGAILLVLHGQRVLRTETLPDLTLKRGSIVFLPANCGDNIQFLKSESDVDEDFVGYIAMYNSF